MKKLLKTGWLPALLLLYTLYRRNRRQTKAIRHMNTALDKANDHIFALTIEVEHLEDALNVATRDIFSLENTVRQEVEQDHADLMMRMMLWHATGFYHHVAFSPDAMILTGDMVHMMTKSHRN